MTYDARQVANFFLDLSDRRNVPLTTMALLKLIFFAHGWYLAERNKGLIKNRFEAWEHGPVVKIIYQQFQQNESEPIKDRAYFFDPVTRTGKKALYNFPEEVTSLLNATFEEYSRYHAFTLSDMSHAPGGPWDRVWNDPTGKVNPGMVISDNEIKQHFRRFSSSFTQH